MKTGMIIGLTVLIIGLVLVPAVAAGDGYTFELRETYRFIEKTDNWQIDVSVPELSGMEDVTAQADLNAHFIEMKDEIIKEYQENVKFGEQSLAEGNTPHFSCQYYWDVITDTEDLFVFRTSWFFGAGSSATLNEYWNLDKKTGRLLDFDADVISSPEQLALISDQIYTQILDVNESEEGVFWCDKDVLDKQLSRVGFLNHWYYNPDGDLVITFDKYEIGPGVMGSPEFTVSTGTAAAE